MIMIVTITTTRSTKYKNNDTVLLIGPDLKFSALHLHHTQVYPKTWTLNNLKPRPKLGLSWILKKNNSPDQSFNTRCPAI